MVSVIIPYIRPDLIDHVWDLAFTNADGVRVEVITEHDTERTGAAKTVNRLVERSKYDLVCFVADDTLPQPGYLTEALKARATLPDGWGLVALNDGVYSDGRTAFHWLADKRLLPILGGVFFHEGYKHCHADNELTERCNEVGRHVYCPESLVIQNRPENDPNYEIFYSPEWTTHDRELFKKRKAEGWP